MQVAGLPQARPISLAPPTKLDAQARVVAIREAVQTLREAARAATAVLEIDDHLRNRDDQLLRARELLIALANTPTEPRPSASAPPDWDEQTYLQLHPDVARDVRNGGFQSGYDHWIRLGAHEGRTVRYNKNRPDVPADFDESGYFALNPDAADDVASGLYASGYDHWNRKGARQRRAFPRPGQVALGDEPARRSIPGGFDEDAYLFLNPDVDEAVRAGRFASGYQHWQTVGRMEHRPGAPKEQPPDRSAFVAEMQARPMGVNLYGFLSTSSGLGTASRGLVKALESQGIAFNPLDVPPWKGGLETPRKLPGFEPYRVNLIQQNTDVMDRFLSVYGIHLLNGAYNIGYWVWELPTPRSELFHVYRYLDEIWVPSEFCRHSMQAITSLPVVRIPHVVDGLDEKATFNRDHFGFPQDVFAFGYIFDVSSYLDRKNPFCLIDAFQRAFGKSRDVLLFLKYYNSTHDETQSRRLKEAIRGWPNIRAYDGIYTEEEILSLHKSLDCFVSPHRGEGFGLNAAEAMYFGKPTIATRYASTLDFMNDANSYLIDYKLIPIENTAGPYRRHSVWADPSTEHLSHLLRHVFEHPEERAVKGRLAAQQIRRDYSAEAVGALIQDRLRSLRTPAYRAGTLAGARLFPAGTPHQTIQSIRRMKYRPTISIITPVYNVAPEYLRRCIESVLAQQYPLWDLCLCDDGSTDPRVKEVLASYQGTDPRIKIYYSETNQGIAAASNQAAEMSAGEYLAMLDNDDEITPDALLEIARAIVSSDSPIDFLYCDEDKIDPDGSYTDHYFKPDWSPEHLHSVMYVLHMLVVRKKLFFEVGGFRPEFSGAQDYDLALRLSTRAGIIHHIPKILYHWRKIPGSAAAVVDAKPLALDAGRRALEDHVITLGLDATVEPGKIPGTYRVRHAIQGNPRASLCILTHDISSTVPDRGYINLVEHTVKSIAANTTYRNYEILICDDANLSSRTKEALRGIDYRLVSFNRPKDEGFNFASKVNHVIRQAKGTHIVLLNDDLEVISPDWLSALLEFSQQSEIGVVGARLLLPGNRLQHAGVVLGVNDAAAHIYHNYPADLIGYNGFTHIIRNYSAVTGACMATRKELIESAGGFDERFPVDYNDIDYCLAMLSRGKRIVYTPYCELYHFEGQSARRTAPDPESTRLFRRKWARYIENDPYYNPNLTRSGVNFSAALEHNLCGMATIAS